ncbi:protein kinase domain-containing protein [Hyalangium rubrum]|uniref:Protein kinase n=1 Tax=Hyalangium rubrum TaxID=3103134 RepID=A0ABU5HGH7_9BACT|nr:protein kinase [Hyalangium sp. s54d21]MDY7232562.1 protein kinase [Hyalangium sp. s54d21]
MSGVPSSGVIPLTRPAAPRRFGQYLLFRKLAEGGMAELYLAKQIGAEGFERDVVIKCMLDHLSKNQDFISMFLDEARLAARLHHPNIVQITDLGVADDRYFICMEYLAGEDLDSLIGCSRHKGEAIPIPVAARIILSALEGLEFAHGYQEQGQSVGLVHRDVSPSNIFVTYQGTVKVLDFGIAKASSRMTQTQPGLLKGKWGYMSPEQARGESIDARSDLFSLGITFHELLTGRRVFERDHEIGVLLALMAQPIPPPSTLRPDIPPALDRIVMKALERQADDRYASASAMRADLEDFLRSTPSVSGISHLAQYMQGLFGPVEVANKTKIPSLTELAAIRVPTPPPPQDERIGYEKTLVRPTDPGEGSSPAAPARPSTDRQPLPAPVPATPPRQSMAVPVAIGALVAVVLLALGGGAAWYFLFRTPAPALSVTAPPVAIPASPVETPPPAPPALPTAPVAQPTPPPATPAPEPTPEPVAKPKIPAKLSQREIDRVFRKHRERLLACGEKFSTDIPPSRRVKLQMSLKNSGEVYDIRISEPTSLAPELAKCLIARMEAARFPPSQTPVLRLELPLVFSER